MSTRIKSVELVTEDGHYGPQNVTFSKNSGVWENQEVVRYGPIDGSTVCVAVYFPENNFLLPLSSRVTIGEGDTYVEFLKGDIAYA